MTLDPPLHSGRGFPTPPGARTGWLETGSGRIRYATFIPEDDDRIRGTVLLAHGLSEQIEKYQPVAAQLLERGFAVVVADWRGHGLSDPSPDSQPDEFKACDDDLALLMERVVLPDMPKPLIGIGHSYGGCLLCCAIQGHPEWFAGGVLCAPMLRMAVLERMPYLGLVSCLIWRWWPEPRNTLPKKYDQHTSDINRFNDIVALVSAHPELSPRYRLLKWFDSAVGRNRMMAKPGWFEAIATPMVLLVAGQEKLVVNGAIRSAAKRMKDAKVIEFEDAWHEILMEQQHIQERLWQCLDEFLDQIAPGNPGEAGGRAQ